MITYKQESITPAKAEQYLNHNKSNRNLREGLVEKYAADMKAGKWTECIVPIVFYEDGDVADGQHRLWAIVESKTSQKFMVGRGLDRAAGLNIDTGAGRSMVDNARISGVDASLSHTLISTARVFDQGRAQARAMSNAQRLELVNRWREPCEWAVKNGPTGKGIRNAVVLAAIARAYASGADQDRLKRFAEVLTSGKSNGEEDYAAIVFREYIRDRGLRIPAAEYRETFLKAMNAVKYFVNRKPLTRIKGVSEEAYPKPKAK